MCVSLLMRWYELFYRKTLLHLPLRFVTPCSLRASRLVVPIVLLSAAEGLCFVFVVVKSRHVPLYAFALSSLSRFFAGFDFFDLRFSC